MSTTPQPLSKEQWIEQAYECLCEIDSLKSQQELDSHAVSIGNKWLANSSFQEWFPYTSQFMDFIKEENAKLKSQLQIAREALDSIANEDYRGNRSTHAQAAHAALRQMEEKG